MLTDDFVASVDSPAAVRSALAQARDSYRQWGVTGTTHEFAAVEQVSEKISRARVHWRFLGEDGRPLIEPTYKYLIRADHAGPRIHVVVSVRAGRRPCGAAVTRLSPETVETRS